MSFWEHLLMVTLKGHYYSALFKGYQWVTQEDPLHPVIFNMVVDTMICPWVMMVAGEKEGPGVFEWTVQWIA